MDMMWYRRRGLMVTPHIERVTAAIASFNSDYNKIPVKSLICNIEPIQEGEGDPSPENVRPISGRTGLNVFRCGKNMLPPAIHNIAPGSGLIIQDSAYRSMCAHIPCSGTYTVSRDIVSGNRFRIYGLYNDPVPGPTTMVNLSISQDDVLSKTFTVPDGIKVILICLANDGSEITSKFQLELGSTATEYEPYKDSTYSVNWETEAGDVYGGTLDVVSGKLTVDSAKGVLNGTESWSGNSNEWYTPKHDMARLSNYTSSIKSNRLKTVRVASVSSEDWHITGYVNNSSYLSQNWIYVKLTSAITTSQELKNWLAENPVDYIYPLTTPTEIQLTPQEVKTLLGTNNIWCDSGDVTVDYWKWGK